MWTRTIANVYFQTKFYAKLILYHLLPFLSNSVFSSLNLPHLVPRQKQRTKIYFIQQLFCCESVQRLQNRFFFVYTSFYIYVYISVFTAVINSVLNNEFFHVLSLTSYSYCSSIPKIKTKSPISRSPFLVCDMTLATTFFLTIFNLFTAEQCLLQ